MSLFPSGFWEAIKIWRRWWWVVVWEAVISALFFRFLFISMLFVIRIIGRGRLMRGWQVARSW